jgi:hypothetical protein
MRAADLVTASVLALVGGVVLFDSVRLGIGWGTDGPRSGFFPFWLAVFMMSACALILVQAARREAGPAFVTRAQLAPVLKVLGPALAMVIAVQIVGLYVAAVLYVGFSMRWMGRHSWLAVVLVALGVPLVTFLVFEIWFLLPMPKGPLEAWLGF